MLLVDAAGGCWWRVLLVITVVRVSLCASVREDFAATRTLLLSVCSVLLTAARNERRGEERDILFSMVIASHVIKRQPRFLEAIGWTRINVNSSKDTKVDCRYDSWRREL